MLLKMVVNINFNPGDIFSSTGFSSLIDSLFELRNVKMRMWGRGQKDRDEEEEDLSTDQERKVTKTFPCGFLVFRVLLSIFASNTNCLNVSKIESNWDQKRQGDRWK